MTTSFKTLFGIGSACLLLGASLLLSGCQPNPGPVAVTQARIGIAATANIRVVTLTPRPTETLTPAPTLPYDIGDVGGAWQLDLDYRVRGYPIFNDIRYSGSTQLTVADDGTLSGSGTLYTTLYQPPCNPVVRDGGNLDLTFSGKLHRQGSDVVGDVLIQPKQPDARQTFAMSCADSTHSQDPASYAILWPALAATDQLHVSLVFKSGAVISGIRNLNGLVSGDLYGALSSQVRLSR